MAVRQRTDPTNVATFQRRLGSDNFKISSQHIDRSMFSLSFFLNFPSLWSPRPGAEGSVSFESTPSTNLELGLFAPSSDSSTFIVQNQTIPTSTSSPFLDANFPPAPARRDFSSEPSTSAADRAFWDSLPNSSRNVEQVRPIANQSQTVSSTSCRATGNPPHHDSFPSAASLERLRQAAQYQRLLAARYPVRPAVRPFPGMTKEEIYCDHWDNKGSWSSMDSIITGAISSSAQRSKVTIPIIVVTNADEIEPVQSDEDVKTGPYNILSPPGLMQRPKSRGTNTRNRRANPRHGAQVWNGPITFYHEELAYFIPSNAYDKPNNRVDVCNGLLQRVDVEIIMSHTEQAEIFAKLCAKQPAFVDVPVAFVEYPEYCFAIMAIRVSFKFVHRVTKFYYFPPAKTFSQSRKSHTLGW